MILNLCLGPIHEEFNMFYISPYVKSSLVVFDIIWEKTPYPVFLLLYIIGFSLAGTLVFLAAKGIDLLISKIKLKTKRSD